MKTTTLRVNGVCNAACGFCELSGAAGLDDGAFEQALGRLQADRESGVTELRLSGGEPLLEPRLPELVARARRMGFARVTLETNGILAAGDGLAARLADAGVTDALWALNGVSEAAGDRAFGVAGAHVQALEGARALIAAGIAVTARTPLSRPALEEVAQVPGWLRATLPEVQQWWLRPITRSPRAEGDPVLLPSLEALEGALRAAAREARLHDLALHIEDELGLPLCLLKGDAHALGSLGRHPRRDRGRTHRHLDPCDGCAARSECPGQPEAYIEQHGVWAVRPFERAPRALVARRSRPEELVVYDRTFEAGTALSGPQVTIRVVMPCNQDCTFCFVDRTSPGLSDAAVFSAIDEAAGRGASRVSFSGGEPTLHRRLADFVAHATERGLGEREIQTNALLLGSDGGALADRLAEAGLTQAVVSLHAVDPERYLRITGAGTPETALLGIRRLLDRGIRVELNVVHNRDNLDHLSAVMATVAARVPEARVLLSVTYIVDGLPRDWEQVAVRYTDAVPHLVSAMRTAARHGLTYRMAGRCGTPPCAWRDDLDALFSFALLDVASEEADRGHRYVEACDGCAAKAHCYGVNLAYLEHFGEAEFQAIAADPWHAAAARATPAPLGDEGALR
ncbi:MAG: radical SAM protein [Deltaproteobacteria bacterium]|nr:radical SAM protein [Deltaproteobacteria bacterium]